MEDSLHDLRPLLTFLDSEVVLHLSTVGADGPHSAPVFYARVDGACLAFMSHPDTQHCRHLIASSGVAAGSVHGLAESASQAGSA